MNSVTVAFQTDKALTQYGQLAEQVEAFGFDGVTVYNDMLYQPAWLPLLEMAKATEKIRVGVAAVNPFTCHPINIAGQIALIDEASNGRAYLGMARGGWLDFVGIQPRRTVTAMREAFACVRHLLQQTKEPLPGEIFPLVGGDALRWTIDRADIPLLLGTWGQQTIRACIGYVDELKIGGSANPDVIPHFRRMIDEGLVTYGRSSSSVAIAIGAVTVVDEDGDAARALARREVALYLPIVARIDPTIEIEPDRLAQLQSAADEYDFERAGALIPDDILTRFAFAGTPEEVAGQAMTLFNAGVDRVEFGTPHGLSTKTGLQLLGERVLPQLRMASV